MSTLQRCRHLSLSGARCTMPAQYNKEFCFNHNHRRVMARSRRGPVLPSTSDLRVPLVTFVYMDDMQSVMENINSIAQAFALSNIDHRQVSSLTYLMNTALKTLDRLKHVQALSKEDMAQQVVYDDLDMPMAAPDPELAPDPVTAAPEPIAAAVPEPIAAAVPEPIAAAAPEPIVAAEPVAAAAPEPVAAAAPEPIAAAAPESVATPNDDCHAESAPAGEASAVVPGTPSPSDEEPRLAEPEEELLTLQAKAEKPPANSPVFNHLNGAAPVTTPISNTCENAIPQTSCIQHLQFQEGGTPRGSRA